MSARPRAAVLVVEDDVAIRGAIRRMLESDGYAVAVAADGAEALALLADGRPLDLLVTDLDMPHTNGHQLMVELHVRRPDLKVLYVTGHADSLFEQRKLLPSTEAYLRKPFTYEGLTQSASLLLYGMLTPPPS
jgi:CheY-like chemotaxis protein